MKLLTRVAATFGAMTMAVGVTGCDFSKKEIINAYDIAVQQGFTGTEEEWLRSLKGADGEDAKELDINDIYQAAQENGYEGSFFDFLEEYLDADVREDNDTEKIAENITSVVSIYCGFTKTQTVGGGWFGPAQTQNYVYSSAGSGVIIDLNKQAGSALIVTNYHVVYDASCNTSNHISDSIYLYTYGALNMFSTTTGKDEGGDGIKATYVGGAMDYDIAILKVEGSEFIQNNPVCEAEIGDSESLSVGEKVFAIGNPDGAGIAVTSGVISVESEYIRMSSTDGARAVEYRVMRTDAAINHGNSGGALFDAQGKLIGITNAKNVDDEVDNMGYALPITPVKYLWENLLDNGGVVKRAMLGVSVSTSASEARLENGTLKIYEEFHVYSTKIEPTAAAYNKLQFGDVFKAMTIIPEGEAEGEKVMLTRRFQCTDQLLKVRKGDTVIVTVVRDGTEMDIKIVYDQDSYFVNYN